MSADELRALQERAAQVEDMVSSYGWPLLVDRAAQTIHQRQTRIVQGKCTDHEDYVRETAFLEGVDFVLRLPERIQLELDIYMDNMPVEEPEYDEEEA
jgi:hypothetical protein